MWPFNIKKFEFDESEGTVKIWVKNSWSPSITILRTDLSEEQFKDFIQELLDSSKHSYWVSPILEEICK